MRLMNLNTLSTVSTKNSVHGTLIKSNTTSCRFLDQSRRTFEDALQNDELLSFRVIGHFSEMFFYLFLLINRSFSSISSVLHLETSRKYLDLVGSPFAFSLLFYLCFCKYKL